MKIIKHDMVIMGQTTFEDAQREAEHVAGDRVRIVKVNGPFFVLPDGQNCPCCRSKLDIKFNG